MADYAATSASGCTPQLGNYAPLTWTCKQIPQQDTSKNTYYMEVSEQMYRLQMRFVSQYKELKINCISSCRKNSTLMESGEILHDCILSLINMIRRTQRLVLPR